MHLILEHSLFSLLDSKLLQKLYHLLQPYSYGRSYRQLLGKSPKRRNSRARHGLQIVPVDHGDPLRRCWSVKKTIPRRELGWSCWPCARTRLSFYLFLRNILELLDKPLAAARPAPSQRQPSARGMFSQSVSASTPPPATKIDFSNADLRRASGLVLASELKKLLRWAS